jgi:hypothetical protein
MATAGSSFAQSAGTFGYGIELYATGSQALNSGTLTLYALDQGGGPRLTPSTSTATLSDVWTSASTGASPTFNLGTFTPGDSLTLTGGSLLTFDNNGGTVTAGNQYLNYEVIPVGSSNSNFAPGIALPLDTANVGGTTGDDRWATESQSINLLAGLSTGTYELETYGYASGFFESNNSANYAAEFTVAAAPEPRAWALGLCALGLFWGLRRLRRQSA